jgi:hypothetical protein
MQGAMSVNFRANLDRLVSEFVASPADIVSVTDPSLSNVALEVSVRTRG